VAVIAGIDEAGYGPLLGPLVVSAVAFDVGSHLHFAHGGHVRNEDVTPAAGEDLWTRLADVVTRSARDPCRVAVDDSKRLFNQSRGVRHIERTALAFAAAAQGANLPFCPLSLPGRGRLVREAGEGEATTEGTPSPYPLPPRGRGVIRPATFRSLLRAVADVAEADLDAEPWYRGADFPIPLAADAAQVEADAARLRQASGARFLGVRSLPVLVAEYNRLVTAHGTKSATLFLKTSALLAALWRDWGERGLIVRVDKHGGRNRYGLLLHQTFFGARVRTLAEGAQESLYTVADGPRRMTIGFYEGGDARHLPVALASIYSKYLRELLMHPFNAWWCERVPGLKPTAGYAADGRRFLRDTAAARRQLGIPDPQLIRIA